VSWRVELPDFNRRAMRALADARQLRAEGDEAAARPRLIAAFMAVFAAVLVTMLLLRRVGWLPKISGGAHALIAGARRQPMRIAGWIRSLLARVRRVDRAAGTQAVPVASPALRRRWPALPTGAGSVGAGRFRRGTLRRERRSAEE
jgi:hypothetical protein